MSDQETAEMVTIRRFHESYPMPLLYHVYCAEHPDFGFCGQLVAANVEANLHREKHEEGGTL